MDIASNFLSSIIGASLPHYGRDTYPYSEPEYTNVVDVAQDYSCIAEFTDPQQAFMGLADIVDTYSPDLIPTPVVTTTPVITTFVLSVAFQHAAFVVDGTGTVDYTADGVQIDFKVASTEGDATTSFVDDYVTPPKGFWSPEAATMFYIWQARFS